MAEQVVLVSEPPYRLSSQWHAVTESFGRAIEADPDELAAIAAEPLSTVTFGIEQQGDRLESKSLLETGEPLPA